jgi:pimeloyl-ACP methyl ester carboxylesterase
VCFVKSGEIKVHYKKRGCGPPLLLLHGIGSNSFSWRQQLQDLSHDYTVLAWDAPGYGQSSDPVPTVMKIRHYVDCVKDLLDEQQMDSIYLLGHSWGGVIAQEFYRVFPAYVKALILADTNRGGGAEPEDIARRGLQQRLQMIEQLSPDQLARERAPVLLSSTAPDDVLCEVEDIMSQVRSLGYRSAAISMSEVDHSELLSQIQIPTLLIWGTEDKVTSLSEGKIMEKAIPGSQLEVISSAGHLCYLEYPKDFNEIVRKFLKGV